MTDEITEYRYHPKNDPIPKGWEKTGDLENTHHGHHSILIKKIKEAGHDS